MSQESLQFDVFLSHNSSDKPAVEALAQRLEDEIKLKPWLDKWNLVPGEPWQEALEDALDRSRTCAVFIGPSAIGPWHNEEMRSALDERVRECAFRVIPVLLPGATMPERGELPRFLSRLTWVDFRGPDGLRDKEQFHGLVCGVKGIPPGRSGGGSGAPEIECPYRGLEVFDEAYARFFFGREAMTQHLVEALRHTRFLAILGPSGSGKSSLARAGLLPQLRMGALPGSQHWDHMVFKPGAHPLQELALSLAREARSDNPVAHAQHLIANCGQDEKALHLHARLLLAAQPAEAHLFLLVDQFEEVFTLCQDDNERRHFIENLRYASTIDGGRAVIVITMRADFLARAAQSTDLAELLSSHPFIVSPMEPDELRRAIEAPAQAVGLAFEPELVERILTDVGSEPGALPLMEHALLQTFKTQFQTFEKRQGNLLTLQAYTESGGVQGALAKKAEAVFEQFTPEQQAILRRVMLRLTQPGEGTADTRRRAGKQDLWTRTEERAAMEKVIATLTDERLLTTSRAASGEEQVDVAHEALIRGWPRLGEWISEDREGLRLLHRLSEDAREWQKGGQDDSFLYHGSRLAQLLDWRNNHKATLNPLECDFLDVSASREKREEEEEKERQRRELEAARQLAEMEKQRAETAETLAITESKAKRRLRNFSWGLALLFIAAIGIALFARKQQTVAEEQERKSRQLSYVANMNFAQQAFAEGNFIRGYELLKAFLPSAATSVLEDVPSFYWFYLWRHFHYEKATLNGATEHESTTFSQNGKLLASAGDNGTIKLWDVAARQELATLTGHAEYVAAVAFTSDGNMLASGDGEGTVRVWDVTTRQTLAKFEGHVKGVESVAFAPDGKLLASGGFQDNTVKLWDVATHQELATLKGHKDRIEAVGFAPNGKMLASGDGKGTIKLWDVSTRKELATIKGQDRIASIAFAPDSKIFAFASGSWRDYTMKLWDVATRQNLITLTGFAGTVTSIAFTPDGQTLVTGFDIGNRCTAKFWNLATDQEQEEPEFTELATFSGIGYDNLSVAFTPDGRPLLAGSSGSTIDLYAVARQELATLKGDVSGAASIAFSSDGKTLAIGNLNGTVTLGDVATREVLATLKGHADDYDSMVSSVAFAPDGKILAEGSLDSMVKLWDVATRQELATLKGHEDGVSEVAFAPDGKLLASGGGDGTLKLWDVTTRQVLATLRGHERGVASVAFAPDGKTLASGGVDGTLKLWDLATRQEVITLTGHAGVVYSVAFSKDSKLLASGSSDETVKLWDVGTRQELATLKGHTKAIASVTSTPDGKLLASGGEDGTVKLWDVATHQELATLRGDESGVSEVAFTPNGKTLAIGNMNGTVRLYFAATDEEVAAQRGE